MLDRQPSIPTVKALLSVDGGICPRDGIALEFDPWSPDAHRCPACSESFTGERHHRWWARLQHLWLGERIAHLAALATLGDNDRAGAEARRLLVEYGTRYLDYPNQDNVLGPSRLFFSTYLESIWITSVISAALLLRSAGQLDQATSDAIDLIANEAANLIGDYNEGMSNRQTWNNAALAGLARLVRGRGAAASRRSSRTRPRQSPHERLRPRWHVDRGRELPPLCVARLPDRASLCPVGRSRHHRRSCRARCASRRRSAPRCSPRSPISPFPRGRTRASASRSRSRCTWRTGRRASRHSATEGDLAGWLGALYARARAEGDAARVVPAGGGAARAGEAGQGRPLLVDARRRAARHRACRRAARRPARCWSIRASPCSVPAIATPASSAGSSVVATVIPIACISRCTRMACTGSPIPAPAATSPATSSGIAAPSRTTRRASTASPRCPATPRATTSTWERNGPGSGAGSVTWAAPSCPVPITSSTSSRCRPSRSHARASLAPRRRMGSRFTAGRWAPGTLEGEFISERRAIRRLRARAPSTSGRHPAARSCLSPCSAPTNCCAPPAPGVPGAPPAPS